MNILMLTLDFPPMTGGIASHVYELSKQLVMMGNKVCVLTWNIDYVTKDYEEINGIRIYRVNQLRIRKINVIHNIIATYCKTKEIIRKEQIEIVHCHNDFSGSLVIKFLPRYIPVVLTIHSSMFLEMIEMKKFTKAKFLLKRPDFLIAPSTELLETASRFSVPKKDSSYIPNGIDIQKFNPYIDGSNLRKKLGISLNHIVVFCPRRLEHKNGVIYFAEAIKLIVNNNAKIKVIIAGEGDERKNIERRLEMDGVRDFVNLVGNIPNYQMPKYYAASDIVLLPSLKEATSIAGLEAMASGKALIGTNVGGIPQIIENKKTGLIIKPRSSNAIAKAILMLVKDKYFRERLGKNARERVEKRFSWILIADETLNVYRRTLIT